MLKSRKLRICVALSVCTLLAMSATATAQQKRVSYEQAWKLCKQALDREGPANPLNTNSRYLRGGACMAKFGYSF